MKIWSSYPSEHSANLVMIGRFKELRDAEQAKRLIDRLAEQVMAESGAYLPDSQCEGQRFSDTMLKVLSESGFHSIYPAELGLFELDVHVELVGSEIRITTDEIDVSAFLKLLVDKGARVEVYSAHQHPETDKDKDSAE